MKLQLSRSVIEHLIEVCNLRRECTFPGKLLISLMAEQELTTLEETCHKKIEGRKKKATIEFSFASLVCIESVVQARPFSPSVLIVVENVIQPIVRKLI